MTDPCLRCAVLAAEVEVGRARAGLIDAEGKMRQSREYTESKQLKAAQAGEALAKAELAVLREVVSAIAEKVGAVVATRCSLEFMQLLPAEVGAVVGKLERVAEASREHRHGRGEKYERLHYALTALDAQS